MTILESCRIEGLSPTRVEQGLLAVRKQGEIRRRRIEEAAEVTTEILKDSKGQRLGELQTLLAERKIYPRLALAAIGMLESQRVIEIDSATNRVTLV